MSPILLILLFTHLRKRLQSKITMPDKDRLFTAGLFISIGLLMITVLYKPAKEIVLIVCEAWLFIMFYILLSQQQFRVAKTIIYAMLPMAIMEVADRVTKLAAPAFYDQWEGYFDTAAIFTLLWLVTMMIINSRQQKALQGERDKLLQKEREARQAEEMKAALEIQVKERTKELEAQKQELEKALDELKAVQDQLIQSEKMASLGELTAGIAHEIQNPLNFVNNFSDVNKELLAEMNEAIAKGDYEEAKALAADVTGNEDKIIFHGKRADAIVKGMLQHSRTSTGQKELTDINVLADEYLRLAFHGLRAKDKTFNAKFETHPDTTLEKINLVPQDIGRVLLNLINNAFYAVSEKKQLHIAGYEPTVSISTKKLAGKVEITVADNGNGIPQKVLDKIFQPFFTTKPTGQGTGLGLSLSYDIVKAHGGELKVETNEGAGTTFIISLPK
jgi:two-component system, NtrC family, sensor kinase